MRSIHHKRAFSKELVLSAFADKLTTRGFRVDHPETIELQRHEIADDYMTVVQILSGRVPNDNQQLTGFVYHIKAAWRQIQQLQEDGDFENKAYDVAQRALNVMGQMHKWLEQQGDDRADILKGLEGEGAATQEWSDDAGCIADLCKKVLLVMGAVQEDVI